MKAISHLTQILNIDWIKCHIYNIIKSLKNYGLLGCFALFKVSRLSSTIRQCMGKVTLCQQFLSQTAWAAKPRFRNSWITKTPAQGLWNDCLFDDIAKSEVWLWNNSKIWHQYIWRPSAKDQNIQQEVTVKDMNIAINRPTLNNSETSNAVG